MSSNGPGSSSQGLLWSANPDQPGELWVSHGWVLSWTLDSEQVVAHPLSGGADIVLDTSFLNSRLGAPRAAGVTPSGFVVSGLRLEKNGRRRYGALLFFDRKGKLVRKARLKVAMVLSLDTLPDGRLVGWWEGLDTDGQGGYEAVLACSIFSKDLEPVHDIVPRRPLKAGSSIAGIENQLLIHVSPAAIEVFDPFHRALLRFSPDGTPRERIVVPAPTGNVRVHGWAPGEESVWLVAVDGTGEAARLLDVRWADGTVLEERPFPTDQWLYPGPDGPLVLVNRSELRRLDAADR